MISVFFYYIHMDRILHYYEIPNISFNLLNNEQQNIIINELSQRFDPNLVKYYFNNQRTGNIMDIYSDLINFVYPLNMNRHYGLSCMD
jgi:hypothetical protein